MDFQLSADQLALRDAARDLLDAAASPERVRAVVDGGATHDADLWKQLVAQGWLALELPEDAGGLGLGFVEVAVLCEEIGRHVAPAPFLSTALALAAFRRSEQPGGPVREWVERLAAGEAIGCVSFGAAPVVDAPIADVVVRVAEEQVEAFPLDDPPAPEPAMDLTRAVAWLRPAGEPIRLGGAELAAELLDRGAAAYAAELLGAADRRLEVATEYAKVREQFGRPIGSFQAVKHRLADTLVDVEGMRSAAYYAAWAVAAGAEDRSLAASTAKAWCSDAGRRTMDSALQVHGGVGFTWEHDLHLYLKRAHLDATTFGDATFHRDRIAGLLRARLEAGADLW